MQPKKFVSACDPMLDYYIFMNSMKAHEERIAIHEYNKLCDAFTDEIKKMTKRQPIEGEFKDAGKIFFCEVRNFTTEKEKIEYMNRPEIYPIAQCNPIFKHTSLSFYKRIFSNTYKIIEILKRHDDHIHDSLTWNANSLFEVVLFHGSRRYIHYFDEEFFTNQLINCLIAINCGRNPNSKIMNAFSIVEKDGSKTLTIKL